MIQQQEQALLAAFEQMDSSDRSMLLELARSFAKQVNNPPKLRLIVNDKKQ